VPWMCPGPSRVSLAGKRQAGLRRSRPASPEIKAAAPTPGMARARTGLKSASLDLRAWRLIVSTSPGDQAPRSLDWETRDWAVGLLITRLIS
jgi:hypothetical protein